MNALVPVSGAPQMTVSDVEKVAHAIAKGGLFGSKDPMAVLTLCLLAQAEGQHPAVVFRDYDIIQGKPSKKAKAMLSDFLAAGGKVKWNQLDDEVADATFSHPSGGEATINWNMARAAKAGLANKDMWKKYPRQMLRSRCISEGVSTIFPGATSGLYVPEEVMDFDDKKEPSNGENHTGETIEGQATEQRFDPNDPLREPAPREKLEGLHSSKTALRNDIHSGVIAVRACKSLEELDGLLRAGAKAIEQAQRYWPILLTGDPRIPEDIGLYGEVEKRRAELNEPGGEDESQYAMLIASMKETETKLQLEAWLDKNMDMIEALDGPDRRKFDQAKDWHESSIIEMDKTDA